MWTRDGGGGRAGGSVERGLRRPPGCCLPPSGGLKEEQPWGGAHGPSLHQLSWRCHRAPVGCVEQAVECMSLDPKGEATPGDRMRIPAESSVRLQKRVLQGAPRHRARTAFSSACFLSYRLPKAMAAFPPAPSVAGLVLCQFRCLPAATLCRPFLPSVAPPAPPESGSPFLAASGAGLSREHLSHRPRIRLFP